MGEAGDQEATLTFFLRLWGCQGLERLSSLCLFYMCQWHLMLWAMAPNLTRRHVFALFLLYQLLWGAETGSGTNGVGGKGAMKEGGINFCRNCCLQWTFPYHLTRFSTGVAFDACAIRKC